MDRLLGLFTRIEAGEGWGACLLAADIFCLLAAYYLLKTARESLILSEGSAEVKSYAAGAQAIILLAAVPLYGMVASRVDRSRLINGVLLFFTSHLALFHLLAAHGYHIGVAFFLWVGVFNLMIVAQFWSFANDLYTVERGQRLFPLVGVGGSLGAWFGARAAAKMMSAHLEPSDLFTIAAVGLLAVVMLNSCISRHIGRSQRLAAPESGERPLGRDGGLRLIIADRYLRLIAILVILVNIVNTTGEYLLSRLVVADAVRAIAHGTAGGFSKSQLIGIFYGDFFAWVNLGSLTIQLLLVSRVFKRVGVAGALFVLPLIACGTYGLFALVPLLAAVRVGKMLENSTDYSLQNSAPRAVPANQPRGEVQGETGDRRPLLASGDVLQAGVVFAGVRLAFGPRQFALLNELFVCLWLVVVVAIYREHKRRTLAGQAEHKAA